jgi:hypothetical protein
LRAYPPVLPTADPNLATMIKAEPGYGEAPLDEDDAKGLDDRIRQLTLPDGRARFGWSVRMRDDWGTVHAVMAPQPA